MDDLAILAPVTLEGEQLALIGGLPSSLTYFAAHLGHDMLSRRHGGCALVSLNDLGTATVERIAEAEGPLLSLAEVPDIDVVRFAQAGSFPIVIIEQSFAEACHEYIAARSFAPAETVRTLARAQVGIDALAAIPRATPLGAAARESAVSLADHIAAALGIGDEIRRTVIAERALERPLPAVLDELFAHRAVVTKTEETEFFNELDRFYGRHADTLIRLEVPPWALIEARAPHLPASGAIDLIGPARCLTFGPYLNLPQGRWRACFTFIASDNASGNTLGFDIACDQEIKVDRWFDFREAGKFAFTCEFETRDPFSPLEFRTFLRRGSIGGEFQPVSLTLERCPETAG